MEAVKKTACAINRPGDYTIIERALFFCKFQPWAKIIDLGCGSGSTVNYLTNKYGFDACGLDIKIALSEIQDNILIASAEMIPLSAASMDGVLMECSFSLMDNQIAVLNECNRVLKTKGKLIISDMFARGETTHQKGRLGRVESKDRIISIIEDNGFTIEHFEDFSHYLNTIWGQTIFEKGAKSFYQDLGVSPGVMKRIKCGYFLIVAGKKEIV